MRVCKVLLFLPKIPMIEIAGDKTLLSEFCTKMAKSLKAEEVELCSSIVELIENMNPSHFISTSFQIFTKSVSRDTKKKPQNKIWIH